MDIDRVYFILEIIGTAAFAVTGVITAFDEKLDLLGAVVLGLAAAVGGGILRDIILGYLPPAAFRVPLFSYCLWGISAFVVFLFGYEFQPLHTKVAQFGCIFIFSGLALRMAASMTVKYLGKIKITGVYALCRHPMLLAQFISFIGVNLLVQNPYFTIMACVIFLVNDCFSAKK